MNRRFAWWQFEWRWKKGIREDMKGRWALHHDLFDEKEDAVEYARKYGYCGKDSNRIVRVRKIGFLFDETEEE